jgi:hypothetical protein
MYRKYSLFSVQLKPAKNGFTKINKCVRLHSIATLKLKTKLFAVKIIPYFRIAIFSKVSYVHLNFSKVTDV